MASKSNRWFGGLLGTMALLCLASCGPGQSDDTSRSTDVPPISEFDMDSVVTDASGRAHYIVNLRDDSADGYPKVAPNDGRFPSYHKPEVRHLIYAFEAQHDVRASSMTSWIGACFGAFMP